MDRSQSSPSGHRPVLVDDIVRLLITDPDGVYLDLTAGGGGHLHALASALGRRARLFGFDRDAQAVARATSALSGVSQSVRIVHSPFDALSRVAAQNDLSHCAGILLDLGLSSDQIDDAGRGFSFRGDGPLDMRMDPTAGTPASTWINEASESDLAAVFFEFGEERHARRIARAIVDRRVQSPILRTADLAALVARAQPRPDPHKHAATRVFQAIRIYLNEELEEVRMGIEAAFTLIRPGGRIAVLTFHSLEDRIVKRAFRRWAQGEALPRRLPVTGRPVASARLIGRGRRPDAAEIAENPRARSALLRVLEKAA